MIRYKKQFEINGIEYMYETREEKKLRRGRRSGPKSIQRRCETGLVLATGVVRTRDGGASSLFQRAALLDGLVFICQCHITREWGMLPYLMPLQGVLAGESLST